jgi:TorA maturation chaperone TorD
MAQQNTVNSDNPSDHISIKLNFVQNIIEHLIKGIIEW